jgi:hypothetical protein
VPRHLENAQQNGSQRNAKHNGILQNDTQHNGTPHNGLNFAYSSSKTISITELSIYWLYAEFFLFE